MAKTNTFIPIGVFWDIENCCVPKWKSALLIVQAVRKKFFSSHCEVEFMCVCDTRRENHVVIQELNQAQVNVVHVDAVSKNAADDKLRQNIRRFADIHAPPARIVLISSDVNFSSDLYDLQYRRKFDIILIHQQQTHESLLLSASNHYLYEDIVNDIPCRTPSKPLGGQTELIVTGYSKTLHPKSIRSKLRKLSSNTGGKVICVTKHYTLLRFSSRTNADRARGRMDGHEFYGSQIHVDYSIPGQYDGEESSYRNYYPDKMDSWKHQTRPYSQSFRSNSPLTTRQSHDTDYTRNDNSDHTTSSSGEVSPLDALLSGRLEHYTDEALPADDTVQGMMKKFNQEKKSSRQLLMLQQQIYQEEQAPYCNESTQFYSHVTQFHETSYHGYNNPWQQSNYYGNRNIGDTYNSQNYNGYDNGYYNYQNSQNAPYTSNYGNTNNYGNTSNSAYKGFQPIRSTSPSETSTASSSPCPFNNEEYPGSVDLLISNLDYNISPREWKNILSTTFHPHVKILYIDVSLQPDNTSLGLIKVSSIEEARFAICQFHRKKIGYKRIHVTLKNEDATKTVSTVRSEAIALLSEAKDNVLPLFKFIELFNKRFNRSVSVSELYRMKDTIEIREQGGSGRMIHLAPELRKAESVHSADDGEVQEIIEQAVCTYHCPEGSVMYAEAVNTSILPNVKLQLKTFAPQVHSLLLTHDGDLPLMSFPACFSVEVAPLAFVYDGGVPLEHLISCVPGVQILVSNTGMKKVHWAENKPPSSPDLSRGRQQLAQFCKEIMDLLKSSPYCRMAFSKFIPSYHQHFGRQCRVSDYGYSRLQEVFEAIPHILQIIGSGDRKVLTLTHRAQVKRFIADLLKLLKNIPGRMIYLSSLTTEFCKMFNKNWDITEYGVCHLDDMLSEIPPETVEMITNDHDTIISLPRKDQSPVEHERLKQFSLEVVDLLKHSHQCSMLFNKFVPAYHHHFGHQCRVSDYGFTKLQDLFEALPQLIELHDEGEEKVIYLTKPELRKVIGEHIVSLLKKNKVQCYPLDKLTSTFMQHYGYSLPLHELDVDCVEQLMMKLKHVLKLEQYDGKQYIVLSDRTSAPPLARQVLQLLMDQSGGSLPLMELCSRYKTTFGIDPDIQKIKEELLDYVQISGDDESGVISLTPLQILARDIRVLLQNHGKMSLSKFEKLFCQKYNLEIKPALYGFPTTVALLMAIPHVISIKGKGNRRMVHLSGDLQGALPIIDESYTRPDSDTPSNDSGSVLTDDDLPFEHKKFLPSDLLDGALPSVVPSPELRPDQFGDPADLIKFESPFPDAMEGIFSALTDEERSQQKTPLCQTPTSQLLKLAAQFLPTPPFTPSEEMNPKMVDMKHMSAGMEPNEHQSTDIFNIIKEGWWQASPSQLQEVSESIRNSGLVEKMAHADIDANTASMVDALVDANLVEPDHFDYAHDGGIIQDGNNNDKHKHHGTESDYSMAIHSLSAAIAILREQNKQEVSHDVGQNEEESFGVSTHETDKVVKSEPEDIQSRCPRPLQPGSYWYSKKFQSSNDHQKELPNSSTDEVRKVLASLAVAKPGAGCLKTEPVSKSDSKLEDLCNVQIENNITPQASIDTSESFSIDTVIPDSTAESSREFNEHNTVSQSKHENKSSIEHKYEDDFDLELRETEELVRNNVALQMESNKQRKYMEHHIDNCVAADCMCYEAVFREDHPIETSSVKSDSSFTESLDSSPAKAVQKVHQKLSTSSLSDESVNSSINKRRSRIAARFGTPV